MDEWISVKERLPEEKCVCLVYAPSQSKAMIERLKKVREGLTSTIYPEHTDVYLQECLGDLVSEGLFNMADGKCNL